MKKTRLAICGFLMLMACGCGSKDNDPVTVGGSSDSGAPNSEPSGTLEIFSWWTAGGEAQGLSALIQVYGEKYPNVVVDNSAIKGGGGDVAKVSLASRMSAGDPPGTFQVHAGRELIDSHVIAGRMEPLTSMFVEQGWKNVMPSNLIDILSYNGDIWSVPVNIHRANVLWYNKAIFTKYNLNPPTTWDEFFTIASTLKSLTPPITPLAIGSKAWTHQHLFETVLLGVLGPGKYHGLWNGTTPWTGANVTTAIETFNELLNNTTADFLKAGRDWDTATGLLLNTDTPAAMTVMGDWAEGYFKTQNWKPNQDFGWVPTPGSAGSFDALSDSFGLPKGAPNPNAVKAWLEVCGSRVGQDAFNPLKGSIPARSDADKGLYDDYLKSSMADFATNAIVPSLTHGAAASPKWTADIQEAVEVFVFSLDTTDATVRDVAAFQAALTAACTKAGVCN